MALNTPIADDFVRISLFGGITIERNGAEVTSLASRKADALVAYLARNPGMHSRERMATMLWDDRTQNRALGNLRVVLASLRKALQSHIEITRQSVGFAPSANTWIDVSVFEALTHEVLSRQPAPNNLAPHDVEQLRQGLDLVTDEFLGGFSIRDAADFEEWITYERERIQHQVVQALTLLIEHYVQTNQPQQGIPWAQRLIQLEPLHEHGHQQLMLLLSASGQRTAALAQYQNLKRALNDEMGIAPSHETQQLCERLLQGEVNAPAQSSLDARMLVTNVARGQPPALPVQLTPFIGRENERVELMERLSLPGCRLLTLVGPGGIGKTRLALAVAQHILDTQPNAFPDGLYFVPLESVSQPAYMPSAMAETLGIALTEAARTDLQIVNYLRHKRLLLIADNFEHLVEGADLLLRILHAAPEVKVLVTSRERLNYHGEWLVELQGLPYPAHDNKRISLEEASRYPALQLFAQDARAVQPSFRLDDELDATIGICNWLEGMPLGIQLAAASARAFSCADILASIQENLDFLRTDMRNIPDRHRSLRAVFEHSWSLLTEDEQRALRQLAVFVGSFSAKAAEHVAGVTVGVLRSLVNRSLVETVALADTEEHLYKIHAVLRQYAKAKLADAIAEERATRNRHAAFYVDMLSEVEGALHGNEAGEAVRALTRQLENIREAWSWSVTELKTDHIERALHSLAHYYLLRGPFAEGHDHMVAAQQQLRGCLAREMNPIDRYQRLLSRVLAARAKLENHMAAYDQALVHAHETIRLAADAQEIGAEAEAYLQAALALRYHGDFSAARTDAVRALELARQHGMPELEGESLVTLGTVALYQGDYARAQSHLDEALAVYRATRQQRGEARALNGLGVLYLYLGMYTEARAQYEQALAAYRSIGDRHGEGQELNNLGAVAHHLGEFEQALDFYEQALLLREQLAEYQGVGLTSGNLGLLAHHMGEHSRAVTYCQVARRIAQERGDRDSEAFAQLCLGQAQISLGNLDEAVRTLNQALALREALGQGNQVLEARAWLIQAESLEVAETPPTEDVLEILAALYDNNLVGIVDPFAVYWTCYRALLGAGDARAQEALTEGYVLLRARAERIRGKLMRHMYMHAWPSRRNIAEALMRARD